MYPINAATEQFEAVKIFGIPGLFTISRVDRSTIPKGMYLYEMQTSEDDWSQPCLLGWHITVEHFGSVLTASPIDLNERGYRDMAPGDFAQGGGSDRLTVAEFEDRCFGRQPSIGQRHSHKPQKSHTAPVR